MHKTISVDFDGLIKLIDCFDSFAHRCEYENEDSFDQLIHLKFPSIPKELEIPDILKYVRLEMLEKKEPLSRLIKTLDKLTDQELAKCLNISIHLDIWLAERYRIGEIKDFFKYLKQRGYKPAKSFLYIDRHVKLIKEKANPYIEKFVSISDFDEYMMCDTPYFNENRDYSFNYVLGVRTIFKNIFYEHSEPATLSIRLIELADSGKLLKSEESVRSDLRHFIRATADSFEYPSFVKHFAKIKNPFLNCILLDSTVSHTEDSIVLEFPKDEDANNNHPVFIPISQMNQIVAAIPSII